MVSVELYWEEILFWSPATKFSNIVSDENLSSNKLSLFDLIFAFIMQQLLYSLQDINQERNIQMEI